MTVPIDVLKQKISAYFRDRHGVVAVYLFGSHAVGKERPFSDVDIGLLFDDADTKNASEKLEDYLAELSRIIRKNIHPVNMNSAGELLLKQIFLKGDCILVNDKKKLSRFKMIMFSKILDFSFYLTQMQSGFVRKMIGKELNDRP
jgi:predicted nucleotidyltransferase